MSRKAHLEQCIRDSHKIISEYERTIQTSDRPEEKLRAQRKMDEHWALIRGYWDEYSRLPGHDVPDDIAEIVARFSVGYNTRLSDEQTRLFRGMDLGHTIDPLRSSLAKMDPRTFGRICTEILDCFRYQTASEQPLESSILARNANIGTGSVHTGVFFGAFRYAQQLFTRFTYSVDKDISRILGRETYFREEPELKQLHGPSAVVIHSFVEREPEVQDVTSFARSLKIDGIANIVFFINEALNETYYLGTINQAQNEVDLNAVPLFLGDLVYQVLTTEVYQEYGARLEWAYKNLL